MAKKQPMIVNGESFATKKDLQERIRGILWSYRNGDTVNMFDAPFLTSLFQQHPDADQKIGAGIACIEVRRNPVYMNTQGFWIVRADGTETDISYLECLTPTSHAKRFERACRAAVEPDTIRFKELFFADATTTVKQCPFTGDQLSFVGSHVDHIAPLTFKRLVSDFIAWANLNIDNVQIDGRGVDGAIQDTFADDNLRSQWIDYHNEHAKLRVISRMGNLSHAKREVAQ